MSNRKTPVKAKKPPTPEEIRSIRRAMRMAELQLLYGAQWWHYWENETNPRVNPRLIVPYKR